MQHLIRKISRWSDDSAYSPRRHWRSRRMRAFEELVRPPAGARIIDLGGHPRIWDLVETDFEVTLVNLPGSQNPPDSTRFRYVEADACDLRELFGNRSFDVVFSNSVIEHVGVESRQAEFAREVLRLADAFWVQTPDPRFPIEAHTGALCYWQRSEATRERMIDDWRKTLPGWADMISETRVLSRSRMLELFPGAEIYTELCVGMAKSNAAYKPFPAT